MARGHRSLRRANGGTGGPNRSFFYSGDDVEPAHLHVERDDRVATLWLHPVRLARRGGFGRAELARLEAIVTARSAELRREWEDYFGG